MSNGKAQEVEVIQGQAMTQPLSEEERKDLAQLEGLIKNGVERFIIVGNALLKIHEKRLYREGYGTWEEYCQKRWDLSRSHAYRVMEAAETAGLIVSESETSGVKLLGSGEPLSMEVLKPLAKLPATKRAKAFGDAAKKSKGKPTKEAVEREVRKIVGSPRRKPGNGERGSIEEQIRKLERELVDGMRAFHRDRVEMDIATLKRKLAGEKEEEPEKEEDPEKVKENGGEHPEVKAFRGRLLRAVAKQWPMAENGRVAIMVRLVEETV